MYDQNHDFGLGPISKTKPKLADTITDTETANEESSYYKYGVFFHHKRAPKTALAAKYQIFLDYFWRSGSIFKLVKT